MTKKKHVEGISAQKRRKPKERWGYDGNPPVFVEIRDPTGAAAGREPVRSQQNINYNTMMYLWSRRRQSKITSPMMNAADQLQSDYTASMPSGRSSFVLQGGRGTLRDDLSVRAETASRRLAGAQKACPDKWGIVHAIVIDNRRIDDLTRALRTGHGKVSKSLREGLLKLAEYYGFICK